MLLVAALLLPLQAPAARAGTLGYAKSFGGQFTDEGFSIAVTSTGTVYVAGRYFDTVDFDPGLGTANSTATGANTTDGFVSGFNVSGDYVSPGLNLSSWIHRSGSGWRPNGVFQSWRRRCVRGEARFKRRHDLGHGVPWPSVRFGQWHCRRRHRQCLCDGPFLGNRQLQCAREPCQPCQPGSGGRVPRQAEYQRCARLGKALWRRLVRCWFRSRGGCGQLSVSAANGVVANDSGADTNKALWTVTVTAQPAKGTMNFSADGSFTYTPNANASGGDAFTYRVTDPDGLSATATASITINAIACGPRPSVVTAKSVANGALQVTVSVSDANGPSQNRLQSVTFGSLQNAAVTVNGQPISSEQAVQAPANSVSMSFAVQRVTPGQATTVTYTVTDSCGSWQSFVGGGTSAGF
ncbi:MAG: cadherin-like domain-containing protein [Chloroflexi bacterium]|nr:cadherin-like domain-containing protein [Chloroflexota bacterium]